MTAQGDGFRTSRSTTRMRPGRSVMNILPSGANAIAHGVSRFRAIVSASNCDAEAGLTWLMVCAARLRARTLVRMSFMFGPAEQFDSRSPRTSPLRPIHGHCVPKRFAFGTALFGFEHKQKNTYRDIFYSVL